MTDGASMLCVDNSLLIRVLTDSAQPATVTAWATWEDDGRPLIAPALLHFELCNALHQYTVAGKLSALAVDALVEDALSMPIQIVDDHALHLEALVAARRYAIASVYDAHYLALAERLGIGFVTADARLYRRVRDAAPWVQLME